MTGDTKAETYLANFVNENTTSDSIDLYQVMRAAGQVETLLELTSHTSYAPVKRQGELLLPGFA